MCLSTPKIMFTELGGLDVRKPAGTLLLWWLRTKSLTFGELMAVLVVLLSIFLLATELLNIFHIFPIRLQR